MRNTYDEAIQRIWSQDAEDVSLAGRILSWISCAHRPLTVTELQHALAVTPKDPYFDGEALTDEILVSVCAGIVTIDRKSNIICLVHHTTQEYLELVRSERFPNAQADIARTCLTYLSFPEVTSRNNPKISGHRRQSTMASGFSRYAFLFWGLHVKLAADEEVEEQAFDFVTDYRTFAIVGELVYLWPNERIEYRPKRFSKLHITASFGLERLSGLLLERTNVELNTQDDFGLTPIALAALQGHLELVDYLLGLEEIDINAGRNTQIGTVLHVASRCGHTETVDKILKAGGDVDALTVKGHTALHDAAEAGNLNIIRLLLAAGSDARAMTRSRTTPLYRAARNGSLEAVKLLIEKDSNVNATTWDSWTPLHEAIERDHFNVAEFLIGAGADLTCKTSNGQTPMDLARMLERRHLVELLSTAETQSTSLQLAVLSNHQFAHEPCPKGRCAIIPSNSTQAFERSHYLLEESLEDKSRREEIQSNDDLSSSLKPNISDFSARLLETYPLLQPQLIRRFASAQAERYSRLIKLKHEHYTKVVRDGCSNAGLSCVALSNPSVKTIEPKTDASVTAIDVLIPRKDGEKTIDVAYRTNLPRSIPSPPSGSLSAEVECSICFKIKTFRSLSSWTKHVYEDIEPYTCTFEDCSSIRSFKHQSDWVSHENGRHREPCRYICHIGSCKFTTIRKSNFCPHIYQVHPDFMTDLPPHVYQKPSNPGLGNNPRPPFRDRLTVIDEFLVDPNDVSLEPCKFCGRISHTWKEHNTHISDHFKDISIGVLDLVAKASH